LTKAPIVQFLQNERVEIRQGGGLELYQTHKDDPKAFIFMDPPYLSSCNQYYENTDVSIYEHLYNHPIKTAPARVLLCLEDIWIIRLLFQHDTYDTYAKDYTLTKKKTRHALIKNF
jgi:hypothetical protein